MENNLVDIFKALANETRLEMLKWLKDPLDHFNKPEAQLSKIISEKGGVCVGDIQERANLSQSTTSHYLSMLQRTGMLESERHGKWTYYRRNEKRIAEIAELIKKEL